MSKVIFEALELALDEKFISVVVSVVLGYLVKHCLSMCYRGVIDIELTSGSHC